MKRIIALTLVLAALSTACAESAAQPLGPAPSAEPETSPPLATGSPSPDVMPAIVVETPSSGDEVSSPVTIAGSADVFEATVSISILDAEGGVIATSFTTATCGSGCRGTYSTEVGYEVAETQPGTIRVFESSAMDGSEINVVQIPVTLTA